MIGWIKFEDFWEDGAETGGSHYGEGRVYGGKNDDDEFLPCPSPFEWAILSLSESAFVLVT